MEEMEMMSAAGTVLSTGANIYNAMNAGIIKAIQYNSMAKKQESEARIHGLDTTAQLSSLDMGFKEQINNIQENYANINANQQLEVAHQGRTLDSLDRIQSSDQQKLNNDKETSLLNYDRSKAAIKGEDDLYRLHSNAEASAYRSGSKSAMINARAQSGKILFDGVETLAQNHVSSKGKGKGKKTKGEA